MTENAPELSNEENFTSNEVRYFSRLSKHFSESPGSINDKLNAFTRFVPRQALATFLARKELFDKIINVHGHIVECGVFRGAGLFSWANLSSIYEPYNHTRRIIGFDTFEGFPGIDDLDKANSHIDPQYKRVGGLSGETLESMRNSINHYDDNRFISQIPRIEIIPGDACTTIPNYLDDNKHLVVALLYLDFDIYKPTRAAIECLWDRMPCGAIIAFDELNQEQWPGETMAVHDCIGISSLRIQRLPFQPQISFAVKD
jgi:hypothetical protein